MSGKKSKSTVPLEPLFKRSVKGDVKGPLPPPLTSTPLTFRTNPATTVTVHPPPATSLHSLAPSAVVKRESSPLFGVKSEPLEIPTAPVAAPPAPLLAGPTQTAAQSSLSTPTPSVSTLFSAPAIPATVRIPIIVGHVPESSSASPAASPTPIVLHDNSLFLNPEIFSHLTSEHLKDLEALGPQKALEILKSYIVRYYKEKLKAEGGRARGRGKPKKPKGVVAGSGAVRGDAASSGPFTTAPLPPRVSNPPASASPAPSITVPAGALPLSAPLPPLSTTSVPESAPSPIVVIDDDSDEGPATKRRRLDDPPAPT